MLHRRYMITVICAAAGLTGCGEFQKRPTPTSSQQIVSEARGPDENRRLHADLVRQMIDDGKLYAALAHLDAQEQNFGITQESRLMRADVLRKTGQTVEAESIYRELVETAYDGYAQHGLGLIYVQENLDLGTEYLRRAVRRRPTDARMHNDLGFALLRQGHLEQARVHLGTAYELSNRAELLRNNYVMVLLASGDRREAMKLARENDMDARTLQDLQRRASRYGGADALQTLDEPDRGGARAAAPAAPGMGGGGG